MLITLDAIYIYQWQRNRCGTIWEIGTTEATLPYVNNTKPCVTIVVFQKFNALKDTSPLDYEPHNRNDRSFTESVPEMKIYIRVL